MVGANSLRRAHTSIAKRDASASFFFCKIGPAIERASNWFGYELRVAVACRSRSADRRFLARETAPVKAKLRELWGIVREEVTGAHLQPPFLWR